MYLANEEFCFHDDGIKDGHHMQTMVTKWMLGFAFSIFRHPHTISFLLKKYAIVSSQETISFTVSKALQLAPITKT